jgi:hypothetical protein
MMAVPTMKVCNACGSQYQTYSLVQQKCDDCYNKSLKAGYTTKKKDTKKVKR